MCRHRHRRRRLLLPKILFNMKLRRLLMMNPSRELVITRNINNNFSNLRFLFDKIFEREQSNDLVFEELSQLIQCSLDGTNVCVFAYGQTGSGKTFTMSHPLMG